MHERDRETGRKKEVAYEGKNETNRQTDIQIDRKTAELTLPKIWEMLIECVKGQVSVKDWTGLEEGSNKFNIFT